jgi:RNA polymerase sigma-70 factor (ECF subfamily)
MAHKVAYLRPKKGDPNEISDEMLVAACGMGDGAALAALFDRHHRSVYGFLVRVSGAQGQDLDDLVQTTFLKVLQSARRFRGKAAVRTWILGIATNVARRHFRGEARRRRLADALRHVPQPATRGPDTDVETQQQLERLEAAVETLPPHLRVAFVMCDLEGVAGVEAARVLGLRQGTLWRRLHEARKALAATIERRHA